MKPTPSGWPRVSSAVFYQDAVKAIDWLCNAFGFELRLKVEGEGGRIEHSELVFGEGLVSVSQSGGSSHRTEPLPGKSPRSLGGANTQTIGVIVAAAAPHCARARPAGAKSSRPP